MENPPPAPATPSISELVAQDINERVKNCKAVIDKALVDFNCSLDVSMLIRRDGNFPTVEVSAKPPKIEKN